MCACGKAAEILAVDTVHPRVTKVGRCGWIAVGGSWDGLLDPPCFFLFVLVLVLVILVVIQLKYITGVLQILYV